ncbi:MAG: A/G-specific adenine glycosylase [Firmicutes bacterium]|nr:A/G-specific adenine glycosylase [Bacillota bacterium]
MPSRAQLHPFRRRLLAWFRRRRRNLPWRSTRDPYRIWISEIMLQQTRVAAALPYYRRFLQRFPSVQALARAPLEAVLRAWSGLGYYNRARNLHRAAKELLRRHNGKFPRDPGSAQALPGVGRYTAAAVLSIAYGAPLAVLDGNVVRVLARLGAVRGELRAPARWRRLEQAAQELLAPDAPGVWNQAMMELGAMVCTPRTPRCGECPLADWCRARQLGQVERFPAKRRRPSQRKVTLAVAVVVDPHGRTLLLRPEHPQACRFFAGLWQFPAVEIHRDARAELRRHLRQILPETGAAVQLDPLPPVEHAVTRHAITLRPFLLRMAVLPRIRHSAAARLGGLERRAISNATRKIAAAARRILTAER